MVIVCPKQEKFPGTESQHLGQIAVPHVRSPVGSRVSDARFVPVLYFGKTLLMWKGNPLAKCM